MKRMIGVLAWAISCSASALVFTTEDTPPKNFMKDGAIHGYSTDILREAMRRTGVGATIRMLPWERAYKMALDDADACVFSTTRNETREPLFKWVGPLANKNWVLFARDDNPVELKSMDEARKYKIGAYQGDSMSNYLHEKGFNVEDATNDQQNVQKLDAGRIDLWVAGSDSGPWLAREAGTKIRPVITFRETQIYLACNKGVSDAVVKKMNDEIRAMRGDGRIERIYRRYQ